MIKFGQSFANYFLTKEWIWGIKFKRGQEFVIVHDCEILSFDGKFVTIYAHKESEKITINTNRITHLITNGVNRPLMKDDKAFLIKAPNSPFSQHNKIVVADSEEEAISRLKIAFSLINHDMSRVKLYPISSNPI